MPGYLVIDFWPLVVHVGDATICFFAKGHTPFALGHTIDFEEEKGIHFNPAPRLRSSEGLQEKRSILHGYFELRGQADQFQDTRSAVPIHPVVTRIAICAVLETRGRLGESLFLHREIAIQEAVDQRPSYLQSFESGQAHLVDGEENTQAFLRNQQHVGIVPGETSTMRDQTLASLVMQNECIPDDARKAGIIRELLLLHRMG